MSSSLFYYKRLFHKNVFLDQFVEIIKQLVQDVEERLVFRTHMFFHHDLLKYEPSPGDLAYPEKLEHMEVSMFINYT